ncbi:thioesterase superfamily [Fusarium pseudocircinatum]|uniref:Thioesterase superfamily n=1 Tax=Fusarium pseudocircinatum TaxID=56676 RepID=A0A8H5PV92_9HYPO|nr:thioesterase superfamily [Fusarium pseudocircinatum]
MSGPKIMPGAQEDLDYFFDIPLCRDQFIHPDAVAVSRIDEGQDGRGGAGKLFSETLNSPSAISHRIVLFHDPSSALTVNSESKTRWLPLKTCSVFYALGDGVCGFGDICHGGVQATLLDDVIGVLGVFNARVQHGMIPTKATGRCSPKTNPGMLDLVENMIATQGIEVQYLRPLRVPKFIQITASLGEISDGRASFVACAAIKDGNGKEYAKAKARWAVFRSKGKL